jgi:sigma-E factor negative regulatory protein RseB
MMRALYLAAGLFLYGFWLSAPAQAADAAPAAQANPQQWLQRMDQAFERYNYDGSFTYFTGADLASLRVVHMVIDGVQRERLVHLNGAPREIVRHGEDVSCIVMPGDDLLDMEVSMPAGPFARAYVRQFDNIADSYSLSFFGTDRVAGRSTVRLAVTPKDAHRFGYRLWLDEDTALLLRSELINAKGKRLEIFQFTNITVGAAVQAQALEPQTDATGMVNHLTLATNRPVSASAPQARWHASWLPPGFVMAASEERRKNSNLIPVSTSVYSDGVAAFSVFVENMPAEGAAAMVSRKGGTVAVTHVLEAEDGQHLVTVVGELPTSTARRIAKSINSSSVATATQ